MLDRLKDLSFGLVRALLSWMTRPSVRGTELLDPSAVIVYVLPTRSLTDLVMLDIVTKRAGLPRPREPLADHGIAEQRRFFFLARATGGLIQRDLMRTYSERLLRLQPYFRGVRDINIQLVPVSIFWSRAPNKEKSLIRVLLSENWTLTSRFRRLVVILFNRRDITVQFGAALPLKELADPGLSDGKLVRRIARLLRVQFRNQRTALLGPDLSHRRTLITQIVSSRRVREAIIAESGRTEIPIERLNTRARKAARAIASDMSYVTIRLLDRLLTYFWTRIYEGVDVHGLERIKPLAETATLVYVPCHRSHVDYLLLSYLLYHAGLMIPHIAAGDNLDMPILGSLLRRGGAFFMRRRFAEDRLYAAVFNEYLYRVFSRGSPVEYFIEGGRSRTGRMLAPRTGLLAMTLAIAGRGMKRPLVFVPVYIGYERLIEGGSYLAELRGSEKRSESWGDLLRTARVLKENFGRVAVNFGEPLAADAFVSQWQGPPADLARQLGFEILRRINASVAVNPINLIALVMLSTPKLAIDERLFTEQLDCLRALLVRAYEHTDSTVTPLSGPEMIRHGERLGMLGRERHPFGDVLSVDADKAVLMTWYRNNAMHTLALPSLIACLIINRRLSLPRDQLDRMVDTVYPYLADETYSGGLDRLGDETRNWVDLMLELGLLRSSDGQLVPPSQETNANYRLEVLAAVVMPTLERFFIVVGTLHRIGNGIIDRNSLESRCQDIARRISRLHGLNAPEFFDARLFHGFVDALIRRESVHIDADGKLHVAPIVSEVVRAASRVLATPFRLAVMRAELHAVESHVPADPTV